MRGWIGAGTFPGSGSSGRAESPPEIAGKVKETRTLHKNFRT